MSKMPPDFSDSRSNRNKYKDVVLLTNNPASDYNIREKIGSGTYGEVYRVCSYIIY